MTSLTGNPATLRRRLIGVLTATGLGGSAAVVLLTSMPPTAVGAADPCAASEMARTISNVARSAGDYLDGHPETNQAMTAALMQPAGPQAADSLRTISRRKSQGRQRYSDDRAAAVGPGGQMPDAGDQPAAGARLPAVRDERTFGDLRPSKRRPGQRGGCRAQCCRGRTGQPEPGLGTRK